MWLVTHLHTCEQSEWWPTNQACHPTLPIRARSDLGTLISPRIPILSEHSCQCLGAGCRCFATRAYPGVQAFVSPGDVLSGPLKLREANDRLRVEEVSHHSRKQDRQLGHAVAENVSEDQILADETQRARRRTDSLMANAPTNRSVRNRQTMPGLSVDGLPLEIFPPGAQGLAASFTRSDCLGLRKWGKLRP
jgi:hypothetical protein